MSCWCGEFAARVDSDKGGCGRGDPVGDGGESAAPHRHLRDSAESFRAKRCAVALPIIGEELALVTSHVDADRAFRFAGSAFEAEVEDIVDIFIAEACCA